MGEGKEQGFWVPSGATLRFPPGMRLADADRVRLWKGLERFVNCGDSLDDYQALGRAFPAFWPVNIDYYPNQSSLPLSPFDCPIIESPELSEEELLKEAQVDSLNWHPACRELFLFYRETLRAVWGGKRSKAWPGGGREEFLMGLRNFNEEAHDDAKSGNIRFFRLWPFALGIAWQDILIKFPTASVEDHNKVSMIWKIGDFYLSHRNDFQKAFYLLFRQNWRARVCPHCGIFFVARSSKQRFCGTECSARSRLASKLRWWHQSGTKRRSRRINWSNKKRGTRS